MGGAIGSAEQDILTLILDTVRELEVEVYKRTGMRIALAVEAEPDLYDRLLLAVVERRSSFSERARPENIEQRTDYYSKGTGADGRIRVGRERQFIASESIVIRRGARP